MNLAAAGDFPLHGWVESDARPGVVIGVLANGNVTSWQARGRMGLASADLCLMPATTFYVASVAKQFTAACVALCAQRGSLGPGLSIRHFLPELPGFFDPVTLRHLLSHSGGVPAADPLAAAHGLAENWWEGRGLWDLIAALAEAPALGAPPGAAYRYSNEGYWLLAAAVERAGGAPLARFAQENLFAPLAMTRSRFRDDPDAAQPGLVIGHAARDGGFVPIHTRFHGVGDGGLLTDLEDLARWDLFWSGRSALGPELPRQMTSRGRLNDGVTLQYAWGVSLRDHHGQPIIGHGGSYLGYLAKFVRFPTRNFSVACLANADDIDVDAIAMALADRVLGRYCDRAQPSWAQTLSADGRAG